MILVCDASVFIGLSRVGQMDLLPRLSERVVIPRPVLGELAAKAHDDPARLAADSLVAAGEADLADSTPLPAHVRGRLGEGEAQSSPFASQTGGP